MTESRITRRGIVGDHYELTVEVDGRRITTQVALKPGVIMWDYVSERYGIGVPYEAKKLD